MKEKSPPTSPITPSVSKRKRKIIKPKPAYSAKAKTKSL
jgi:hypothetical protein